MCGWQFWLLFITLGGGIGTGSVRERSRLQATCAKERLRRSDCTLFLNARASTLFSSRAIDPVHPPLHPVVSQMTIMSRSCAERCNLLRLMDKRWEGMAVGVGSAKILGEAAAGWLQAGGGLRQAACRLAAACLPRSVTTS